MTKKKLMVSSTVYGVEDLLEQLYEKLEDKYTVIMSHKGTVRNHSTNSCYKDCEEAVASCDLFLGIITPSYGSGTSKSEPAYSITHREMLLARDLNKTRFFMVNEKVVFASNFLNEMRLDIGQLRSDGFKLKNLAHLSVIQMYRDILDKNQPHKYHLDTYVRFKDAERKVSDLLLSPINEELESYD